MFFWKYCPSDDLVTRSSMIPAHSIPILEGEVPSQPRDGYKLTWMIADPILPLGARFADERLLHDTPNFRSKLIQASR